MNCSLIPYRILSQLTLRLGQNRAGRLALLFLRLAPLEFSGALGAEITRQLRWPHQQ